MLFVSLDSLVLGASPWWSPAVAQGLGLRCLLIAAAGAAVLSVLIRAMWNLSGRSASAGADKPTERKSFPDFQKFPRFRGRLSSESGTATVEFVLVFPVALVICLVLLQTVLMFTGNLFVNYAAYAATRSAIVQAPDGAPDGGGALGYGSPAFAAVERAAGYAMVPVSGKGTGGGGSSSGGGIDDAKGDPAGTFEAGLTAYFGGADDAPAWVENLAGPRMRYALEHTKVKLYETRIADNGVPEFVDPGSDADEGAPRVGAVTFGPKDPVTIGVTHRLHLSIPYVSKFFFDGTHATEGGDTHYADLFATCTMTLEGYDRQLPPLPEVERE